MYPCLLNQGLIIPVDGLDWKLKKKIRGKGSVGDKVKCHLCEEIVHRYKLTRTRAKDNHMWKHFRNGDFNSEWEAEEKTKRREDAMRMMFDAFNGRNDIIPDEPDRPEDLNQIHHDEDDV